MPAGIMYREILLPRRTTHSVEHWPPGTVHFMKKSGAKMNESCYCEYDGEFKSRQAPLSATNVYDRTPAKAGRPNSMRTPARVTPSNVDNLSEAAENLEVDFDSEDEKPDDLGFRFADGEEWAFRSSGQNPVAGNVERVRMPPQEISALEGLLVGIAGESKYYFTVNSLTSIVTVRWKHSERGLRWDRFVRTIQTDDSFGFKKSHSSSSSSLSIHAYSECIARAKRWRAWHFCRIYDTRPLAMAPRAHPNVP